MNVMSKGIRCAAACLLLALGACGGGGDDGGGTSPQSAGTVVGAAGGTVVGPNGARIVIPPGALATDTTIAIGSAPVGASGAFALMRLSADGVPDGSFGSGGLVTTLFSTQDDYARAVALQPDGRIVLGGFARNGTRTGYGLVRINP